MYRRLGGTNGALQEYMIITIGKSFFVHHRIVSVIKMTEFVTGRVSYIVLRGSWCNIIVLNVHAPSEGKNGVSKDSFMRN